MFEIDSIPKRVLEVLSKQEIAYESLLLGAYCDRDTDQKPAEVYLFATERELLILCGETAENDFCLRRFDRYPIDELHDFHVEELLSAGRLVVRRGEEDVPLFLASFTNFCKESMFLFAKYAGRIAKGEAVEIDPKDDPSEKFCPKCGMRYPDANRHICPRCMEKGKLFRRFSVFLLRYKGYLIFAILSLSVLTGANILVPYFSSGFFYDEVIYGVGEFAGQIITVRNLLMMCV